MARLARLHPVRRVFRDRYAQEGRERLGRRRIFILPTSYGVVFAVMLLVMLLGSINYGVSLGFMLTFLLASIGLVSLFHTYRNLAHLSFEAGKSPGVFAGQTAQLQILVNNRGGAARHNLCLRSEAAGVMFSTAADTVAPVILEYSTRHRGRLEAGVLRVDTAYPLGLFRAWSYVKPGVTCMVYPQPAVRGDLPVPHGEDGSKGTTPTQGDDDFKGFRPYLSGDSTRRVNWKPLARGQEPVTKQFEQPVSSELWFDISQLGGDTESRLSLLCRWIIHAERQGVSYGLRLPGTEIVPGRGKNHEQRCLEALAVY